MTRKITVANYASVDGVIEDPVGMEGSGLGNWTGPFKRGPAGDDFKNEELRAHEAVLLGRVTYEGFAPVWPTIKDEAGFADHLNAMPKFVASNTLKEAEWNNTTIISGDTVEAIRALKEKAGGDILIYGSASLTHSLMKAGLVDAWNLMVFPVALGAGKRQFPEGYRSLLRLADRKSFGSGITMLRYEAIGGEF